MSYPNINGEYKCKVIYISTVSGEFLVDRINEEIDKIQNQQYLNNIFNIEIHKMTGYEVISIFYGGLEA